MRLLVKGRTVNICDYLMSLLGSRIIDIPSSRLHGSHTSHITIFDMGLPTENTIVKEFSLLCSR